ncbi:MAG: DNA polymerase III subunit gamma/tau [Lachnospiraceae bacterium]|nr:DNA polymerase III subunit gamma/tau [Lachnospiraceae bacterium]
MAYTALYRKWRPQRFEDVRGQDHIVRTLKNQLNSGRVGHAYLFSGTRGTGKTTVAKILARAVNCEHPVDGSPCNECATCKAILSGASVNVIEIDAASNNGVDNIREIREEVRYRPTEGKYRVYIIDEVHMLSSGAFNALLKTLEEPPEYVIFILATTEAHQIPITVLSRCQRYDFKRLSRSELESQLKDLLDAENIPYEDRVIPYIARQADGSSRDALSLMERCISSFYGEKLRYEEVLEMLGAVDQRVFRELVDAVIDYDVHGALKTIDGLVQSGRELSRFVTDLIRYLRNLMLIASDEPDPELIGVTAETLTEMKAEAERMDLTEIMRCIRILSELYNQMRYASDKRVLLEIAVIKMMQPAMETDLESLKDRVRFLEAHGSRAAGRYVGAESTERTGNGTAAGSAGVQETSEGPRENGSAADAAAAGNTVPVREVSLSPAAYEDYRMVSEDWEDIVAGLSTLLRSFMTETRVSAGENGSLKILFKTPFNYEYIRRNHRQEELKELLKARYGRTFNLELTCLKEKEEPPRVVLGSHIPGIEMEIEEEESEE